MKMSVKITCDCGNQTEKELVRITNESNGKVYEDYLSFEDSFEGDTKFNINQSHPDEARITCLNCNNLIDFLV